MGEGKPDLFKAQRECARLEANELLWENLEESLWWDKFQNFSEAEIVSEKIRIQHELYHPTIVSFMTSFIPSVLEVSCEPAKLVLQYGASRRLQSVYSSINTIAEISYPGRTGVCSERDQTKLADALLVFYVSIPAFFDALSMASHRVFLPEKINEKDANLFSRKYWEALGLGGNYQAIANHTAWYNRVKNDMRHHYAHRISPYVPSAEHSAEDAITHKDLEAAYSQAMTELRFDDLSMILDKMQNVGSFSPKLWYFEKNSWMPLNPTVFNDLLTFQVVGLEMLELLLPETGFLGIGAASQL